MASKLEMLKKKKKENQNPDILKQEQVILEKINSYDKPIGLADRNRLSLVQENPKKNETTKDIQSEFDHSPANVQTQTSYSPANIQTISRQCPANIQTQSGYKSSYSPAKIILTPIQNTVYQWFVNNGLKGTFNRTIISEETNIKVFSVKSAIVKFKKFKIINIGKLCSISKTQKYKLNPDIEIEVLKPESSYGPAMSPANVQTRSTTSYIVSSKSLNKTNLLEKIEIELNTNRNISFWKETLSPKKINHWIDEFEMSFDDMIESLSHCAWDLKKTDSKDKTGKPISDIKAWIYKILKKDSYYEKPTGYKSLEEIQLERAEQRLYEQKKRAEELDRILEERKQLDQDIAFKEMCLNKESPEYKLCLSKMSKTALKRGRGPVFERDLLTQFLKHVYNKE